MNSNTQAYNQLCDRITKQRLTVTFNDSKVANYLADKISNGVLNVSQNVSEAVRGAVSDELDSKIQSIRNTTDELKTADTSLEKNKTELTKVNQDIKKSISDNTRMAKTNHALTSFTVFVSVILALFVLWFKGLGSIPFVNSAWHAVLTGKGMQNIALGVLMIILTYSAPFFILGHVWRLVSKYCFGISYADFADESEWDLSDYPKYLTTKKDDDEYYQTARNRNWWWWIKLIFWHLTLGKHRVVWRKEWQEIAKQTRETHTE